MKFAFAAVLAAVGFADAKRVSKDKTRSLLRKAVPVNKDGSRRQLNQQQEEWEIDGNAYIKFDDCVSLTWANQDALEDDLYQTTANGLITPQTSYVTFEVYSLNYYGEQTADLWMIPLADWFDATSQTAAQDKENYCQACEQSYDMCYYGNGQYDNQQEGEGEGDQGDRKYKKRALTQKDIEHRATFEQAMAGRKLQQGQQYVDCATCEAKGCFWDDANDYQNEQNKCDPDNYYYGCTIDEDDVNDFLGEAGCSDTGLVEYSANGDEINLMAGLMCNADGTGIEPVLFADEDCSLYYNSRSFSSDMGGTYLYALLGEAATTIMEPYVTSISCEEIEYVAYGEQMEYDQNNNGEAPEANEACQGIMEAAADIYTCGGAERKYEEQNYDYNQNQDGENQAPASWAYLDFTDGEEPDAEDVCWYVHDLGDSYHDKHVFDESGGNFFDYGTSKDGSGSSGAGKTLGIIIAVAVVVVAGVLILQNFSGKRDSKKVPLVGNQKGAMA